MQRQTPSLAVNTIHLDDDDDDGDNKAATVIDGKQEQTQPSATRPASTVMFSNEAGREPFNGDGQTQTASSVLQSMQENHQQRADSGGINPSVAPARRYRGVPYVPDAASTSFLTNMGFTHDQAVRALKVTQGSLERAANWLLSGM